MAEYGVLAGEPRHKVDDFVDEVLTRTREVIAEVGPALEQLLRDMIAQFHTFRAHHYLITLQDVRFEWVRWTREGQLVVEFSADPALPHMDDDVPRHESVDDFVDGVVGRTVPEDLRDEFAQFTRGMVMQFAVLKKNRALTLRDIAFGTPVWHSDRQLVTKMTYQGEPLCPQGVRL